MNIPVYILNGFLESGKTKFICETLQSEDFDDGDRSLVVVCEEGIEEYDDSVLKPLKVDVVTIDSEDELTKDYLQKMCLKYKPERVFIEFNGMWRLNDFLEKQIPKFFDIAQIITLVDASTFDLYLANMKSVMMEQFKCSEMVIFNRCVKDTKRASYRRSVKAVNGRAQVYFESSDGSSNEVDEVLPFDMTKDEIEIANEDYGIWYVDAMDNPKKYDGKVLKFLAVVYKPKSLLGSTSFVPGRFAMTCCADDIRFIGIRCKCDKEMNSVLSKYKDRDFVYLTAKAKCEFAKEYRGNGIILYAMDIQPAKKPEDDLVYFN